VVSAADYWDSHDLNDLADDPSQFETLTAAINAGLVGLVDRVARWRGAQTAIAKFGVF
jgi:predicted chitinase